MKSNIVLSSLALAAFSASVSAPSAKLVKCYGVSAPYENDCAPLDIKPDHPDYYTCGKQSKRNRHWGDWKTLDEQECINAGGGTEEKAREKLNLPLNP